MDLKISDVSEMLNVSKDCIEDWLREGAIPAYKINQEYRFSRLEIEDWLLQNNHSLQKFAKAKNAVTQGTQRREGGQTKFSFYRALHKGRLLGDVDQKDKEELIQSTVYALADSMSIDPEVLSELLIERERLHSTALNRGVAVPHTRELLGQLEDSVTVVFPKVPIEYGAIDGEPVHTLFFLFAKSDKSHLNLLAKIAHLTGCDEALNFLKSHPKKPDLLAFIKDWELGLRV